MLPNGLTYRVRGRPHPNGALAFLFENISAEISLTRKFRTKLDGLDTIIQNLEQIVVLEVYVGYAGCILTRFGVGLAVSDTSSSEFLELHDVLGQRSRLVTEDVGDHAELLI